MLMYDRFERLIKKSIVNTLSCLVCVFEKSLDEAMNIINDSGLARMWEIANGVYATGVGYELATLAMDRLHIEYDPQKKLSENPPIPRLLLQKVANLIYDLAYELQIPLIESYKKIDVDKYLEILTLRMSQGEREEVFENIYINIIKDTTKKQS